MIYIYTQRTGMGRLAKELGISVTWPRREICQVIRRPQSLSRSVNWGCGERYIPPDTLNFHAQRAHSKISTFRRLAADQQILLPTWADTPSIAMGWNSSYLARRDGLTCGLGIERVAAGTRPTNDNYDFYVKRIARDREFRIHANLMIDNVDPNQLIQAKLICSNRDDEWPLDFTYTSHQPERFATTAELDYMVNVSRRALSLMGLDYGAIDFLRSSRSRRIYLLEINTAPGISCTPTREFYSTLLRGLYV